MGSLWKRASASNPVSLWSWPDPSFASPSSSGDALPGWRVLFASLAWVVLVGVGLPSDLSSPALANHVYDACDVVAPKEQTAGRDTSTVGDRGGTSARIRVSFPAPAGSQINQPATAIVRSIYVYRDDKNFVELGWKFARSTLGPGGETNDPGPTVFVVRKSQGDYKIYEGSQGNYGNPDNPGWGLLANYSDHHFKIERIFDPNRADYWYRFERDGMFVGSIPHAIMGGAPPLAGVESDSFCDSLGARFWDLRKCFFNESRTSCTWQNWDSVKKATEFDRYINSSRPDSSRWWKFQWGPGVNELRVKHCGTTPYCDANEPTPTRVLTADPCVDEPCDSPSPQPSPTPTGFCNHGWEPECNEPQPSPSAAPPPPPSASWSSWERHDGGLAANSGLDATSWQSSNLRVVSRSPGNNVWLKSWDCCSAWSAWTSISAPSGGITSDPSITASAPNVLHVFARGTDNAIWTRKWSGSSWGTWTSLGSSFTSGPDAMSVNGYVLVFARGTDNGLWQKTLNPQGTWSAWESHGGTLTSDPSAVRRGSYIDVFARGSDGRLVHKWFDGGSWSAWQVHDGVINSSPDASSWGGSRLDVFAAGGGSNNLYQLTWNGSTWGNWASLGSTVTAPPGAVSWGSGRIDVFTRGTDAVMYHRWCEPCG